MVGGFLAGGSAEAATRTVSDPAGDATERLDVTEATFGNGQETAYVELVVPQLERRGTVRLIIGPPTDGDEALIAKVSVGPDGSLKRQFSISGPANTVAASCDFMARWSTNKGRIRIAVPWTCIHRAGGDYFGTGRLYLAAITGAGDDYVDPARRIQRG